MTIFKKRYYAEIVFLESGRAFATELEAFAIFSERQVKLQIIDSFAWPVIVRKLKRIPKGVSFEEYLKKERENV